MTTLDYALAYIRRGWSIIPLKPRSKEPAVKIAEYLSGEKRMTEEAALDWWGMTGVGEDTPYGIAIICGQPSGGLVVVDVDPRNGGDVQDVQREIERGDGQSPVVMTGGGGAHFYCRHDGPVAKGKTARPGVDRQADGGYVIAPPSIHPSGGQYYWLFSEGYAAPLLDAPAWVVERPQSEMSSSGDSEPWVADALAHPEDCRPGTQEETLTKLCWWAAGHLDYDIAHALLCSWVARLPLSDPHDPWGPEHVESRLDRAFENREPEAGYVTGIVDDLASARKLALRDKVRNAPTFIAQVAADESTREWIAEDFVAPGCFTEVLGVMKEGKTTFVGGLLHAVLHGEEYLGRACKPTSVLYVTEQVGRSFQKTLERAELEKAENLYILTLADIFGTDWKDTGPAIIDLAVELGCRIVVIDTLSRLAGIEEEDEARSVTSLNPLLGARARGIAVVFVRHSRKSGGAINVAGRGSGAITGEMDVCLYITAPEGVKSNYRHLEAVSRLSDAFEIHLEYDDGRYIIGEDPATAKREHRYAAINAYLSAQGMRLVPYSEVTKAVSESTKKSVKWVQRVLAEMVEEGRLEKTDAGYRIKPEAAVTGVTA